MDSLHNLHLHDPPSGGGSFQTASVSHQSLIELLNGKLAGGADKIELSADQVREIIQGLRVPQKFPPIDEPESSATKELAVLKHHCRLGDYAGRIFNDLKFHNTDAPLPKLATELVELLGEEGSDGPMARAIEGITYRIRNQGGDIDSAMAKFAVKAYAARNQVCHGEAGHLVTAEKWDDLAQRISLDLEALPEILPEDQMQQLETWRRILRYYRDRYIVQDSNGKWQKREEESLAQLPDTVSIPKDRPIRGLPRRVAKYRFDIGHFRVDPAGFSSLRPVTDRGRVQSLSSVESPKRKASGPPEGDSAPESPSKKRKTPQGSQTPSTTDDLFAKTVSDLFAQIEDLRDKKLGKSLTTVQELIRSVKIAQGLHGRTEQTQESALGDGAEEGDEEGDEEGERNLLDELDDVEMADPAAGLEDPLGEFEGEGGEEREGEEEEDWEEEEDGEDGEDGEEEESDGEESDEYDDDEDDEEEDDDDED
ncbi:hypothetical protein F5884DRAFT_865972 [Xylogone sp. PMI_703]|nr:hypothetical protein F5884DRAFT_865972 [Xylogone sp. PMI_703]